ncbi:hypothetical protein RRG08_031981 [Elysia crispata]|uniref:Uncharacterized protein n=1 Tax=Elysia crispata TaxID=231223 RepID=A0AAE0Z4B7_9GAST|nr:hypothetical protein RRG08_031981 [Elysia crispata]
MTHSARVNRASTHRSLLMLRCNTFHSPITVTVLPGIETAPTSARGEGEGRGSASTQFHILLYTQEVGYSTRTRPRPGTGAVRLDIVQPDGQEVRRDSLSVPQAESETKRAVKDKIPSVQSVITSPRQEAEAMRQLLFQQNDDSLLRLKNSGRRCQARSTDNLGEEL